MAKIEASINDHDALEVFDWARNFLTQAQTGAESGVGGTTRKHRKVSLDTLRALLVEVANVVNGLTTEEPGKVLDARQGKVLADAIAAEIAKYAQPNGIATLGSDGKIPSAQIPSIALVDVFPVSSEAAMLASGAEQGDMAIRSDTSQVFILSASPATTIENWIELSALKALVDASIADLAGTGRTTETVKKNADDIAKLNADNTTEGSVAKSIKDAVDPVSTELSTVKVKTVENDLAIADIRRDQTLANQSEAKISISDYGIVALPKNATGNLKMKREGLTARNIVNGASIAIGGTVTFASVLNSIYYDTLHKVQITGTGSDIVITNDSGAIANMAIINLTQTFSSIPTLAQCKNIFPTYFADTKNVPMTGRYRGKGKNIAQKEDILSSLVTQVTFEGVLCYSWLAGNTASNIKMMEGRFAPNTQYTISGKFANTNSYTSIRFTYTDGTEDYGEWINKTTLTSASATSTAGKTIEYLSGVYNSGQRAYAEISSFMVEAGATATTYATYEAHDLYFTAPEGRSVPSSKDSVEVQDGKLVHVKRVSTPVAVSSGVAVNVTNYPLAKTGGNFRVGLTAGGVQIGVISTDSTSGAGDLTYELATPITTHIDSDGNIPAGASVLWEPAILDVGIYTTKFDILDTDHPIASIDKLYKVDFATGVPTLITDAVVAGDGLSFTSASLTDGDLVNVIYFYATANPEGLTTVEYLNSNVVIADTDNGKYYIPKPVITNGAFASWDFTEVV